MPQDISDLDEWLVHYSATTYADDTTTGTSAKLLETVLQRLEEDAENVLKFMASNGLVANPTKTTLMILNNKNGEKISIKINDLQKILADMRNSDGYKHWQDLGSQVVQQITERIYNGYTLFFKALKNKEKGKRRINPPKAKKLYKYKSITFKQAGFKLFQDNKM